MRYRWAVLIFVAAFLFQICIVGNITVFGASVNLILCTAVITAFAYPEDTSGLIFGSLFALIYDFAFSPAPGVTALALAVTVLIGMGVKRVFLNSENSLSAVIVSLASVIVYYNLYWCLVKIAGINTAYTAMLTKLPLYLILNFIVMFIMYQIMISKVVKHKTDRYTKWADL